MNTTFGKYINRNTIIHNFDGRFKLLSFIFFLVMIFLWKSFTLYLLYTVLFLLIFFLAQIPVSNLRKIFKSVLFMAFFLFLFNLISLGGVDEHQNEITFFGMKNVIFELNFIVLRWSGIFQSLYYALRVFLVILLTVILTSTTSPDTLTFAIESLLFPLRYIRFPVYIFSTIISLTLRLVPTLSEEAQMIMKAQASRGLDFKNGNLRVKIRALVALLIPLIVSIFHRAEEMALAMESRGYNPQAKRTKFQQFYLRKIDWLLMWFVILFFFLVLFWTQSVFYNCWDFRLQFDNLLYAGENLALTNIC